VDSLSISLLFILKQSGSSRKTTLWEGGHREVGIATWKGTIAPGVTDALASTLDFLPVYKDLCCEFLK